MEQKEKQLLVFGYGLPMVLLALGAGHWRKHGFDLVVALLLGAAGIVLWIVLFDRPALKILFKYWMCGARWIGGFITAVVLIILFFSLFSIVGIILRLSRKDLLRMRLLPQASSYWMVRSPMEESAARLTRQF